MNITLPLLKAINIPNRSVHSFLRWAENVSHISQIEESITSCVDCLHEIFNFLSCHLCTHVLQILFKLWHRYLIIFIAI